MILIHNCFTRHFSIQTNAQRACQDCDDPQTGIRCNLIEPKLNLDIGNGLWRQSQHTIKGQPGICFNILRNSNHIVFPDVFQSMQQVIQIDLEHIRT